MVQDMYSPEIYLAVAGVRDRSSGALTLVSGRYCGDGLPLPNDECEVSQADSAYGSRLPLYCIPIAGESDWARLADAAQFASAAEIAARSTAQAVGGAPVLSPTKRSRADEDDSAGEENGAHDDSGARPMDAEADGGAGPAKRARGLEQAAAAPSLASDGASGLEPGVPLASVTDGHAIAYFYSDEAGVHVNDLVELVGVLAVEPAATLFAADVSEMDPFFATEALAHHPPGSLVARIHVLYHRVLAHAHPCVPQPAAITPELFAARAMPAIRGRVLAYLASCLGGDALAAEYALLTLLSRVVKRTDTLVLGKMSLNLTAMSAAAGVAQALAQAIGSLRPTTVSLALSVPSLNGSALVPVKDYAQNRLLAAPLQLGAGTPLVLDESGMDAGTLHASGVANVQGIAQLLAAQTLPYNFVYHTIDFPVDAPVFIVSQGRSLFTATVHVPLQPLAPYVAPAVPEADAHDAEGFLIAAREYLELARWLPWQLDETISAAIEADFVALRQERDGVSQDMLHTWITLARWLAVSCGETCLSAERWAHLKSLETARYARLDG